MNTMKTCAKTRKPLKTYGFAIKRFTLEELQIHNMNFCTFLKVYKQEFRERLKAILHGSYSPFGTYVVSDSKWQESIDSHAMNSAKYQIKNIKSVVKARINKLCYNSEFIKNHPKLHDILVNSENLRINYASRKYRSFQCNSIYVNCNVEEASLEEYLEVYPNSKTSDASKCYKVELEYPVFVPKKDGTFKSKGQETLVFMFLDSSIKFGNPSKRFMLSLNKDTLNIYTYVTYKKRSE